MRGSPAVTVAQCASHVTGSAQSKWDLHNNAVSQDTLRATLEPVLKFGLLVPLCDTLASPGKQACYGDYGQTSTLLVYLRDVCSVRCQGKEGQGSLYTEKLRVLGRWQSQHRAERACLDSSLLRTGGRSAVRTTALKSTMKCSPEEDRVSWPWYWEESVSDSVEGTAFSALKRAGRETGLAVVPGQPQAEYTACLLPDLWESDRLKSAAE